MAVIDRVILKGRHIVILESLQRLALEHLPANHREINKTKFLAHESIYWTGMKTA